MDFPDTYVELNHDLLSVQGVIKQDEIVTVSSLGRFFVIYIF